MLATRQWSPLLNMKLADWCLERCLEWFGKGWRECNEKGAMIFGGGFKPLVLSTGGLVSSETADEWKSWRKATPEAAFRWTQKRITIELVKARARISMI